MDERTPKPGMTTNMHTKRAKRTMRTRNGNPRPTLNANRSIRCWPVVFHRSQDH